MGRENEEKKNKSGNTNSTKTSHVLYNDGSLKEIPAIGNPKQICVAYFHNNVIEKINNLNEMTNLTHLYLQWNKIERIENISTLINLKKLHLGYNRISVIENLENLKKLQDLNIERQELEPGESLCAEPKSLESLGETLQILNISGNSVERTEMLGKLHQLRELSAKDNSIEDFQALSKALSSHKYLRIIDFRGNPMCSKHRYKETLIAYCQRIDLIDGKVITDLNRKFLKSFEKQRNLCDSQDKGEISDEMIKKCISPDSLLTILEAKRNAKEKARQLKMQEMASCSVIPRCFWRNRTSRRCKDANEAENNEQFDYFYHSRKASPQ